MKIVILDAQTLGSDLDLAPIQAMGEVLIYELTEPDEVAARIRDAEVVITNKVCLNEGNLKDATCLKMIALFATGFNNIDIDYAGARGIAVANVAGYSTQSVTQHTFAMLFHLLEKLSFCDNYVKAKDYVSSETFAYIEKPFYEIHGKTWGIIGMGAIGQGVASVAQAFGVKVVYYSTSGQNNSAPYERVELEELLKVSDIVSIHAPLNERTQDLIGYDELRQMKKSAILLNLGRGGIIKEDDLARALNEDLIRGAALDVLAKEPILEDNPLYTVKDPEKWMVTPHIAWASIEARTTLVHEVVSNITACFNGEVRNRII